jgi:hypothetical protein
VGVVTGPLSFLRDAHAEAEQAAEAARGVDYAQCGAWEARGPYPAASGEADGVLRPRGNLRAEIGTDDIFLDAELPWDLIPHMALHDPAAVLRRIAAERKVLDGYELTVQLRDEAAQRIRAAGDAPTAADLDTWDRAQREAAILEEPVACIAEGWGWVPSS